MSVVMYDPKMRLSFGHRMGIKSLLSFMENGPRTLLFGTSASPGNKHETE